MLKKMRSKSAILFDLDGTLLDTAHDLTLAFNQVIPKYTGKTYSLAETRKLVGYGSRALFLHAFQGSIDETLFEQFKKEFLAAYQQASHCRTALFDGMEEVLMYLNAQHISWGIVTNKPYEGAVRALKNFPLLETNHCLVGCDTASYPKPSPEPLLYACTMLNISPADTYFVGDTPTDMEAAHHAHIDSIAVTYGYGTEDIQTSPWQPTLWINDPKELLGILKED